VSDRIPPELEFADTDADPRIERRNRRIRGVAWVVVAALIIGGGGSTILLLLFG